MHCKSSRDNFWPGTAPAEQIEFFFKNCKSRYDTPEHPLFSSLAPGGEHSLHYHWYHHSWHHCQCDLYCWLHEVCTARTSTKVVLQELLVNRFEHNISSILRRQIINFSQITWHCDQGPRQPWQDIHCQLKGKVFNNLPNSPLILKESDNLSFLFTNHIKWQTAYTFLLAGGVALDVAINFSDRCVLIIEVFCFQSL